MSTNANQPEQTKTTGEPSFDDLVVQVSELAEAGKVDEAVDLIDRHPEHAGRLRRLLPAIEALATLDEPTPPSANEPQIQPRELGDFRIVREIGRGGMGVVYEAEQLSLGRRMALKVLPLAATLSTQQLQRFKNEARLAASLKHPHIVGVHSVGVERGVHYYAMELVEGCSLAQAIANLSSEESQTESPQTDVSQMAETTPVAALSTIRTENPQHYFRRVAKMVADAADALDYAHNQGIVHRDIKPGNLLLDADANVWVTDFGLARLEAEAGVTLTGDLLGTLRYMSPEQAAGRPGMVDYRTDIHALGATLYELLTMRPAFEGSDRVKLLHHIAEDTPTPLRRVDPKIPVDLETIAAKALEKESADRYQTSADLASDLRAFLEHREVSAKPPTMLQRIVKWSRRHVAATWSLAACLLVTSVLSTWLVARHSTQQRTLVAAVESDLLQARRALAGHDLALALMALNQAETKTQDFADSQEPLLRKLDQLNDEVARYEAFTTHYDNARSMRSGFELSESRKALALYGVLENDRWQEKLAAQNLPQEHVHQVKEQVYELLILRAWHRLGAPARFANLDATVGAQKLLTKAAAIRPPTKGYYWVLATCSQAMGDLTQAEVRNHHIAEALRLRELAKQADPQNASELFYISKERRYGSASYNTTEPFRWPYADGDELLVAYREMLRIEPDYYHALFYIGLHHEGTKNYEAAIAAFQGCVAVRPDDSIALGNSAECLAKLGHYEESLAAAKRAVDLAAKHVSADKSSLSLQVKLAGCLQLHGECHAEAGDFDKARSAWNRALAVCDGISRDYPNEEMVEKRRQAVIDLLNELDEQTDAEHSEEASR